MIITQCYRDVCEPNWRLLGAVCVEVDSEYGPGGHSVSNEQDMIAIADRELCKRHGLAAVLLNASFTWMTGSGHPDYGHRRLRVVGDLYVAEASLPCGLKELPPGK